MVPLQHSRSIMVKRVSHRIGKRKSNSHHHHHHHHNHCQYHRRQQDWSNIDYDMFGKIQKKLPLDTILLRCRAVCRTWRSLTRDLNPPNSAGVLIIWNAPASDYFYWFLDVAKPAGTFNLYQLNHKSELLLRRHMALCVGFSHGWFIFLDKNRRNTLCLFHPLLSAAVRLPPIVTPKALPPVLTLEEDDCEGVQKVVLWADPISTTTHNGYGIAVIHPCYKHIIFAKSGAVQFTNLEYDAADDDDDVPPRIWQDIICFQNRIYGVTLTDNGQKHHMEAWEFANSDANPVKVLDFQPTFSSNSENHHRRPSSRSTLHLVESEDELLLVSIQRPDEKKLRQMDYKTKTATFPELFVLARCPDMVRVYKMDFKRMEWVQMASLGDRVLFIMENKNVSVSSREFPQYKRNTVYFTHHIHMYGVRNHCVGVFNMEDGSMEEIWPDYSD